jgi:hypothetical protein
MAPGLILLQTSVFTLCPYAYIALLLMISEKHLLPFICLIFMLPRALNYVLLMAGSLKRCNPSLNEDVVIIRALRDSNLPKFLAEDSDIFQVRIFIT